MLHCASTAVVVRPLALDAGVLPDSATGAGVAQTQGVVCEPSSTGPPRGWLVIVRLAQGRPLPLPLASATNRLSPAVRPVSTPRSVRASASATKAASTLLPLSVSVTLCIGTSLGTRTSTSASPSLTRSARFDKVLISKLKGGSCGLFNACADSLGVVEPPPPQPAATSVATTMAPIRTVKRVRVFISLLRPGCAGGTAIALQPGGAGIGNYPSAAMNRAAAAA